jgi:lipid-A-disaccharide synthase
MALPRAILFSAFETSGDHNAAAVIAALRELSPRTRIYALGGRRMREAGAELLETSTGRAVMFLDAAAEAWGHHRRMGRLRRWLRSHAIDALVPVDSPAANWGICKLVRRMQPAARIVHLSAPQLWAWAGWRIHKMRRLSDHVLCLNPFEPAWFEQRGMGASFVGHPLFSPERMMPPIEHDNLPTGRPRLALIPGSRKKEIRANWPTMLAAFAQLRRQHPGLHAMAAALDEPTADMLADMNRRLHTTGTDTTETDSAATDATGTDATGTDATRTDTTGWPPGLSVRIGQIDTVLEWCDAALVVSGTATLDVTVHRRPMVVMYNFSRLLHTAGRWLLTTRTFSLPNLIAESCGLGRAVPELVPHFGQVQPVVDALEPLLSDPTARQRQTRTLEQVAGLFAGIRYGSVAAQRLLAVLEPQPPAPGSAGG